MPLDHFKNSSTALRTLLASVFLFQMIGNLLAEDKETLLPGTTPRDAVMDWLNALKSERETKDIINSPLVAISPYCPKDKRETYTENLDRLRQSIRSLELSDDKGQTILINRFAGIVLRMSEPGEPLNNSVISVAAIKNGEGWKVPVGIHHFDNVHYGFDKELSEQQANLTRQLSEIQREISIENEMQAAADVLDMIREKRELMELNNLEPEELARRFVYPETALTKIERLSFLAVPEDASATDLDFALRLARNINNNTSSEPQPTNAEIMAEALNARVEVRFMNAEDVREARAQARKELEKQDDNQDVAIRPVEEMPWPADALCSRQYRSSLAVMLPKSVREQFGELPDPYIEIIEKTVSKDANQMAISFGLFDPAVPGRFDVLPVYLRKISGQWKVALPDAQIFESSDPSDDIYSAIRPPSDELIEWYHENYLDHLDLFAEEVVDFANESGDTPKFESPRELVQAYIEAVNDRDLPRCIRLAADRSKAFSRDFEDLLDAIKKSYTLLDTENNEIHVAGSEYTIQHQDSAAMLWVTRIPHQAPGKIVVDAVIAENAKDGEGWKISPGIHDVFPISERPNIEVRKTLPPDEKQAEVLAEIDKLRVAQESEIRDSCMVDLFAGSRKIDKIDPTTIKPLQTPELGEAQALIDRLSEYHLDKSLVELINLSSTMETDDKKYYQRVLSDIGNDRAFFREVGQHLEALGAHVEGRWLGIIVRDSRIAKRSEPVENPSTKDVLSLRLFVRVNDEWSPLLGGSLWKEINSSMRWINRRFISILSEGIGDEDIANVKALKTILDETPTDAKPAESE